MTRLSLKPAGYWSSSPNFEFLPGVTLIGTDGGGTGYGLRFYEGRSEYVSTPLIGMDLVEIEKLGNDLEEFATRIRDNER